MRSLFASLLFLPLAAFAQPIFPPATQSEVDAGTVRSKFVSPYTLQHATLSGLTATATNAIAKTDGVGTNTFLTNATVAITNATADRVVAVNAAKTAITTGTSRFLFDNFFLMGISNIVAANVNVALGTNNGVLWVTNLLGAPFGEYITNRYATANTFTNRGIQRQEGGFVLPSLLADRAAIIDANNNLTSHVQITATELSSLDGVTGVIEDRLNAKMDMLNGASTNQVIRGLPAVSANFKITNGWLQIGNFGEVSGTTNNNFFNQRTSMSLDTSGTFLTVSGGASLAQEGGVFSLGANGIVSTTPTYMLVGTNDYIASGGSDANEAGRYRFVNDITGNDTNQVMRWLSASNLIFSMVGGVGEANVLGRTGITNSTDRFALENDKIGITNELKSVSAGFGISLTNQSTNIVFAVTATTITNIATNSVRITGSGNVTVTPSGSAGGFTYDISSSGGAGTPTGADNQVQYASNSLFQSSPNFVYDYATSNLTLKIANNTAPALIIDDTGVNDFSLLLSGRSIRTTNGQLTLGANLNSVNLNSINGSFTPGTADSQPLGTPGTRWLSTSVGIGDFYSMTNRLIQQPWVAGNTVNNGVVAFGGTNSWTYIDVRSNMVIYPSNLFNDTLYYLIVNVSNNNPTISITNTAAINWVSGYQETPGTNVTVFAFLKDSFFGRTNAWVEGRQELGIAPGINTLPVTNGNNLSFTASLTVNTNSGSIAQITNLAFAGLVLSNDVSGKATVHGAVGGAAGNPGGAEATLQVKMGSVFVGATNSLYDVTNSVLTATNIGFKGWVTNFYKSPSIVAASSNVICDGSLGSFYKLYVGGFGITNFVFTNIQVGQTIQLLTYVTNGTYARILVDATEATAGYYVGANGTVPLVNSNALTVIEVTRTVNPSQTNITVQTRDLEVTPGYAMTFATNVVSGLVTQNVSTVLGNIHQTGALTNQFAYLFIPAGSMISNNTAGVTTTSGATNATLTSATTNRTFDCFLFSGTASNSVQAHFMLPLDWDTNTLPQVKVVWTSTNAIANSTNVWGVSMAASLDDDVMDQAMGTEVTITNKITAANDIMISGASTDITPGGTRVGNSFITLQIRRQGNNANDNASGDSRLLGAWVRWKRNFTQTATW